MIQLFQTFKKIGWFIRTYRKQYIIALSVLLVSYVFSLIPPWMIGNLTDQISSDRIELRGLLTQLGLLLATLVLSYIGNYIWSYYLFMGSDRIARNTRRRLMTKFLRQSPIFYENNTTGSLMGKSTNDVNAVSDFAGFGFMSLIDATMFPLVILLIMATTISLRMTLLAVIPMPLLIIFTIKFEDKITLYYRQSQEAFDSLNDKVLENVSGVRVVRAYGQENYEIAQFKALADNNYNKNILFQTIIAYFPVLSRLIPGVSFIIALLVGAHLISLGELSLGKFISFTIYLDMLVWPMFAFGEFITVSEQASTAMSRIQELFDYKEEVPIEDAAPEYPGRGDLSFRHFSFSYPNSTDPVLHDITFTLPHGKTLGIVGKIGSGKTSLVRQLMHLYPIDPGTLYLGDRPIEDYNVQSVRRNIGYVPQQHVLFSKSIDENIRLGSQEEVSHDRLLEVLKQADFIKDLVQLPHGLDTMTGEKGIALSGGQKQRISIARALLGEPEILILDDSLSAVDATTEANILASIQQYRQGKTNLITAHRLSAIAHADLILVLEDGRIIQQGTHNQLFNTPGWYRDQFLHQQLEGGQDHDEL